MIFQDVCGLFCAILTWALIFYALFVVLNVILLPDITSFYGVFNSVVFVGISVLAISSHLRTMFSDPVSHEKCRLEQDLDSTTKNQGAVPRGNATKENIQQMGFKEGQVIFKCPKCCSIKPDRAHHCSVCQVRIKILDKNP